MMDLDFLDGLKSPQGFREWLKGLPDHRTFDHTPNGCPLYDYCVGELGADSRVYIAHDGLSDCTRLTENHQNTVHQWPDPWVRLFLKHYDDPENRLVHSDWASAEGIPIGQVTAPTVAIVLRQSLEVE